jgi:hypothetical protein
MGDLLEADITSTLDALVADGVVVCGPYKTIDCEDEGYPVRVQRLARMYAMLITRHLRCSLEFALPS